MATCLKMSETAHGLQRSVSEVECETASSLHINVRLP